MIPIVRIDQAELLAVPAVHNRSVFAEQVNRICRDEGTRPGAIAVELSQDVVDALVIWLRELGIGPGGGGKLPCMLGLAKTNRRIHPRYRQAAIRLQELHGKPLHQISSDILRRELNFSPVSFLCLSPTDSIFEAVRSGVELGLPVYGIDLGEIAEGERTETMLQDPLQAREDLAKFVVRNAACIRHRDNVVDERREHAMAARLKRLLREYSRVLFTCGIGHWHSLEHRLADPAVSVATSPSATEHEQFQRVVVAPNLAIYQMDVLPVLTEHYESGRLKPIDDATRRLDYATICGSALAEASGKAGASNQEVLPAFCQYLKNLSLLNQRQTADLFMILTAAREMVSPTFATRLGEILVTEALDWARSDQWPDLPYLRGASSGLLRSHVGLQAELEENGRVSAHFYISHRCKSSSPDSDCPLPRLRDPIPPDGKHDKKRRVTFHSWVWPPCESLLFGTAYAASDIVDRKTRVRSPEPFSGCLYEGVDVKATLRATIRGEKRIQVKALSASMQTSLRTENEDDPTVFIFERDTEVQEGSWSTFIAGYGGDIRMFVHNQHRFDEVTRRNGDDFVASVQFCDIRKPPKHLRKHVESCYYLYGITLFGNPSLNPLQSARWLEASDYTGCPITRSSDAPELFSYYQREHRMALDQEDWVSSLIRLALPYAKRRVTVLLPKNQPVSPTVQKEVNRLGLSLETLPLGQFPPDQIQIIRSQYLVQPLDVNRMIYSEGLEKAMGETPAKHLELLPERIRAQLEHPD